jgi:hypothetical protein
MPCDDRTNSGLCSQSTRIPNAPRDLTSSSAFLAQSRQRASSARWRLSNSHVSNTPGTIMGRTATRVEACHPRTLHEKRHHPTSYRPIRLLLCAEDCRSRNGRLFNKCFKWLRIFSRRKLRTISWCKAALPGCGPIRVAKKLLCVCVIDYQSEGDKVSDADRHSQQYQQRSQEIMAVQSQHTARCQ